MIFRFRTTYIQKYINSFNVSPLPKILRVLLLGTERAKNTKRPSKLVFQVKLSYLGKMEQNKIIKQSLYVLQNYTKMNAKKVCCLNPSQVLHATTCHYSIFASVSCLWNLKKPTNVIQSESAPQEISPLKSLFPSLSHDFSPQSSIYHSGWSQDGN